MAATRTITIVVDSETDDELTALARSTGRDKQSLAQEALSVWLEDQEDIRKAKAIIAQGNPTMTLEEVKQALGLAN